jgi:hypothetical protein
VIFSVGYNHEIPLICSLRYIDQEELLLLTLTSSPLIHILFYVLGKSSNNDSLPPGDPVGLISLPHRETTQNRAAQVLGRIEKNLSQYTTRRGFMLE